MASKQVGFLFGGQGGFQPFFGKDLYDNYSVFRSRFDRVAQTVNLDLPNWAWGKESVNTPTSNSRLQITLMALELALASLLEDVFSQKPILVTGHSLGEVIALAHAEAFDFDSGCRLIKLRGEAMEAAGLRVEQDMLVIFGGLSSEIQEIIAQFSSISLANINSENQIVVGGIKQELIQFSSMLQAKVKVASRLLGNRVACHTPLLNEASLQVAEMIDCISFSTPKVPYFAVATGNTMTATHTIQSHLREQMIRSVDWLSATRKLSEMGGDSVSWIEVSPAKILKGLALQSKSGLKVMTSMEALRASMG